jgi:Ca2+-binding EF-hand superfamily protein
MMNLLRKEFSEMDTSDNNLVSQDEFHQFLMQKAKEHQDTDEKRDYERVISETFNLIDFDHSGSIAIEEFVKFYF